MQQSKGFLASACLLAVSLASIGNAQVAYEYTRIVDPTATGTNVFNTIQGAIADVDSNPTTRWTILIYAGVYEEDVTLGDTKENVDLVGVDPDAVIIKPPLGDNGIVIDGLGERNNSIRNLKIVIRDDSPTPSNLDGILIKKPSAGADPSGITIENVHIELQADGSRAIRADVPVSDVTISGVNIECTANAGSGIVFDDTASEVSVISTSISTSGDDGHAVLFSGQVTDTVADGLAIDTAGDDAYGIYLAGGDSTDPNADIAISRAAITTTGDDAHAIYLEHETDRFSLLESSLSLTGHLAVPVDVPGTLAADSIEFPVFDRVTIRHTNQVARAIQGEATLGMGLEARSRRQPMPAQSGGHATPRRAARPGHPPNIHALTAQGTEPKARSALRFLRRVLPHRGDSRAHCRHQRQSREPTRDHPRHALLAHPVR